MSSFQPSRVRMIIAQRDVVLRALPNEHSKAVGKLRLGTVIELTAVCDGWVAVGRRGWVRYDTLQPYE